MGVVFVKKNVSVILTAVFLMSVAAPLVYFGTSQSSNPGSGGTFNQSLLEDAVWWNDNWNYRTLINISTGFYNRTDVPIEVKINFTRQLEANGVAGTFDLNSVRVVEYSSMGEINDDGNGTGIPSQFDEYDDFDASTNAVGAVIWIMKGHTPSKTNRYYYIYFDTINAPKDIPNYIGIDYAYDPEGYENAGYYTIDIGGNRVVGTSDKGAQIRSLTIYGREQIGYANPNSFGPAYNDADVLFTSEIKHSGPIKLQIDFSTPNGKKMSHIYYYENMIKHDNIAALDGDYQLLQVGGDASDDDEWWDNIESLGYTFHYGNPIMRRENLGWGVIWDSESKDAVSFYIEDNAGVNSVYHLNSDYDGYELVYMWDADLNGGHYYWDFSTGRDSGKEAAVDAEEMAKSIEHPLEIIVENEFVPPNESKHPWLFFKEEDIPGLREKTADSSIGFIGTSPNQLWEGVLNNANEYAASPPPKYEEYEMREVENRLLTLSFAYVITQDTTYLEKARETMSVINKWSSWEGTYLFGKLSVCRGMAIAYDMLYNELSEAERFETRESLIYKGLVGLARNAMHGSDFFNPAYAEINNNVHVNYYSALTIASLALLNEHKCSNFWTEQSKKGMTYILDCIGENGGWREGLQYGSVSIDWALPAIDALNNAAGYNLYTHTRLKNLLYFPIYQLTPTLDGNADFGEVSYSSVGYGYLPTVLASKNNNQLAAWYMKDAAGVPGGVFGFLWYDQWIAPKSPEETNLPYSWHFKDISWTFSRTGWDKTDMVFGFKNDYKDVNHGSQNDCNHFILNYAGNWLASDQGKHLGTYAAYKSSTIGHNTLLIDNEDDSQKLWIGGHSFTQEFMGTDFYDYIKGNATAPYHNGTNSNWQDHVLLDKFIRNVVFVKPNYLVMYDDIKSSGEAMQFNTLHHTKGGPTEELRGNFSIDNDTITVTGPLHNSQIVYKFLEPQSFTSQVHDTWWDGTKNLDIASSPEMGPYISIGQPEKKIDGDFLSVMYFQAAPKMTEFKMEFNGSIANLNIPENYEIDDVDNDNQDEIVCASGEIIEYNPTTNSYYESNLITFSPSIPEPHVAIGDIDDESTYKEIVYANGHSQSGYTDLAVVRFDGSTYNTQWQGIGTLYPFRTKCIDIGNVDGDSKNEIVLGGYKTIDGVNKGYVTIWEFDKDSNSYTEIWGRVVGGDVIKDLAVGDVDGDHTDEIAVISGKDVYILDYDGNDYATSQLVVEGESDIGSIKIGNIDLEGNEEIVLGRGGYDPMATIIKYDPSSHDYYIDRNIDHYGYHNVFDVDIGDVDNSGVNEIVFADGWQKFGFMTYDLGYGGYKQESMYNLFSHYTYYIRTGDTDGDGRIEVITNCGEYGYERPLYIFEAFNYNSKDADLQNSGGADYLPPIKKINGMGCIGVEINRENLSDLILFKIDPEGSKMTYNDTDTDGIQCTVSFNNSGGIELYAIQNGSYLNSKGQVLFSSSSLETSAAFKNDGFTTEGRIKLNSNAAIQIHSESEPIDVFVDDIAFEENEFNYDPISFTIGFELGSGEHDILITSVRIFPDLHISDNDISLSPENPTEGDEVVISARIHNNGVKNAENVIVQFFDEYLEGEEELIESREIDFVGKGGSALTQVVWNTSSKGGSHKIHVKVDPLNSILEENETNNLAFKSFTVNSHPKIEPLANQTAVEDAYFECVVNAQDIDGDELIFSDDTTLFDINPATGVISFTPMNDDVGVHSVMIFVEDSKGGYDEQEVVFKVLNVNDPPTIFGVPDIYLESERNYDLDVTPYIHDEDNTLDQLMIMTDSQYTGVDHLTITFRYPIGVNSEEVRITVSDGQDSDYQNILVTIKQNNTPPQLVSSIPDVSLYANSSSIGALDLSQYFTDDDFLTYSCFGNNSIIVTIHDNGSVDFSSTGNWYGEELITLRAKDPYDSFAEDTIVARVIKSGNLPPIITIRSPIDSAVYLTSDLIHLSITNMHMKSDLNYLWKVDDKVVGYKQSIDVKLDAGFHRIIVEASDGVDTVISSPVIIEVKKEANSLTYVPYLLLLSSILVIVSLSTLIIIKRRKKYL